MSLLMNSAIPFVNADQIILLNNGGIEEIGNHQTLMELGDHYYRMVKEQEKARAWVVQEV
ncbi:MAG: hypothetical protein ACRDBO_05290 [Lachnospiraceae bacterium]